MFWLFVISVLIFLGPKIWESFFTPRKAAQEIVADTKALYSERHEFAEVSASSASFRDLDHGFYARAKSQFEAAGFRYLADMEDRTVSRRYPKMRTLARMFLGDDGTVSGAAFHNKVRGWLRLLKLAGLLPAHPFYFDLETEFSDGTFLVTTNTRGADLSSEVAGIERQALPQTASVDELVEAHRGRVEARCGDGAVPRPMYSIGELWEMQHRLQELKNAAKARLGFVDHEQIAAVMAQTSAGDSFEQARKDEEFAAELIRLRQQNFSDRSAAS